MALRAEITRVEPGVDFVDTRRVSPFGVSGVYLVERGGLTLIEAGTSLTAPYVLQAVRDLGGRDEDVRRVVVTHVHLDHAGAAGWFAKRLPWLKVYVHPRGAPHLADPGRLLRSAESVYGGRERVVRLHGEVLPVPLGNLVPITDGRIDVGGGTPLEIFDAPGHAPHHLGIFDPATGCLFPGEALGHYYPEVDLLTPAVAPPSFDGEATVATTEEMRRRNPGTLCFSQFGPHRDPGFVFQESKRQLASYEDRIREGLAKGLDETAIIGELSAQIPCGSSKETDLARAMVRSIVLGFVAYFRRPAAVGR